MRYLERSILLQVIDNRWREHLYDMDYLREGIHLRGFAQIDPLVAYKNEGFAMFEELMHSIWEEFSKLVFHAEIEIAARRRRRRPSPATAAASRPRSTTRAGPWRPSPRRCSRSRPRAARQAATAAATAPRRRRRARRERGRDGGQRASDEKIGRNDPCWCGSGKKYKKCHGA